MNTKQHHNGNGDNIAGNKYQQNVYSNNKDINSVIDSKIKQLNNPEKYNLGDNKIMSALKEVIIELVEEEQNNSHQIVPITKIRSKFKNLFDDETFETLIKHLIKDKTIAIEDAQICYVNKQNNFKINI